MIENETKRKEKEYKQDLRALTSIFFCFLSGSFAVCSKLWTQRASCSDVLKFWESELFFFKLFKRVKFYSFFSFSFNFFLFECTRRRREKNIVKIRKLIRKTPISVVKRNLQHRTSKKKITLLNHFKIVLYSFACYLYFSFYIFLPSFQSINAFDVHSKENFFLSLKQCHKWKRLAIKERKIHIFDDFTIHMLPFNVNNLTHIHISHFAQETHQSHWFISSMCTFGPANFPISVRMQKILFEFCSYFALSCKAKFNFSVFQFSCTQTQQMH